jgi:Protein of unknown function (DUF3306)
MSSEGFLSRWSRRKQEVREAERPQPHDLQGEPSIETPGLEQAHSAAAPAEEELSAEEIGKLPSLDDLTADMDLSMFLRKGVPEGLRNAALRRMWSLDPKIRDFVCEAREYAYDWNTPGGVPGSGLLPPSDEIARMAARIVGAGDLDEAPGTGLPEPERPQDAETTMPAPPSEVAPHAREIAADTGGSPTKMPAALPQTAGREPEAVAVVDPTRAKDAADGSSAPRRHGGAMPL